jgi:hypothetical protein
MVQAENGWLNSRWSGRRATSPTGSCARIEGIRTANSPVLVADLWTNSDPHQAADCLHPDDAGAQRMGLNWYNALAPILR